MDQDNDTDKKLIRGGSVIRDEEVVERLSIREPCGFWSIQSRIMMESGGFNKARDPSW
jgi:hypothetical protein